ncbi:MAG TPA: phosphopyruvate hydratase [Gammaproteobacteria bacterium]|nr:phosphopyruvate hydratase [Gammaproteobacteria bacterium]
MNPTGVSVVRARRVWDSRGNPTVEAEVRLENGAAGRAIAPAGASRGSREARELRDGGRRLRGLDVTRAVAGINQTLNAALRGLDAQDQERLDAALVDADGSEQRDRLGANALVAVSMAAAHAAAAASTTPLWRRLLGAAEAVMPLPEIQIFGGGAHAGHRIDVQDFMIMAPGAQSFAQALEWTAEVYHAAGALLDARGVRAGVADEGGYWPAFRNNGEALDMLVRSIERAGFTPGEEIVISLDVAASELRRNGRYRLGLEDRELDSDAMAELVGRWIARYPIASVEDPLAEDDEAGLKRFTEAYGEQVQIVGDDYLVTDAARVNAAAANGICNAVLLKPNQRGTLTETRSAWEAARKNGFGAIVSARSGESEDITIVHLAVGWGVPQLKVGSFSRSERMAKWNEGVRIEEALGAGAKFAGASPLRGKYGPG